MKMQNAELEFLVFEAQDVIATSGGGFWFTASELDYPASSIATQFDLSTNTQKYIWLYNTDGTRLTNLSVDKSYQLICEPNELNNYIDGSGGKGKEIYAQMVAEETAKPFGTQISTWQGILDWIDTYSKQ